MQQRNDGERPERRIHGMLGEMVFECNGKWTGTRVLKDGKCEVTIESQGQFLGEPFGQLLTAEIDVSPDGLTGYEEFRGFFDTREGSHGQFSGYQHIVRNPDGTTFGKGVCFFTSPPGKYEGLNKKVVIIESETDMERNVHQKGW
jgi:hypothetical protein